MSDFASEYMYINCLGDYASDCKKLDPESFAELHGEAFLLHHGPIGGLKQPVSDKGTVAAEARGAGESRFDPQENFLVFEVRRRSGTDADPISVGRDEGNDLVIPDASVSSLHAFFTTDLNGEFHLADNGSMNGTFVNAKPVLEQGRGEPMPVKSHSRVRFGSVVMTFMRTPDFYNLVRELM